MIQKTTTPFGSWPSPIKPSDVSTAGIGYSELQASNQNLYWLETRPAEGGRGVIVKRRPGGQKTDITPKDMNVRTTVHEYGGGNYVVAGDTLFFSNYADQRVYKQVGGDDPVPLTPEGQGLRYADFSHDARRGRLICVREDHRDGGEPRNTLVAIDVEAGGEGQTLFEGTDFVSSPRLSPDDGELAWLSWDHPNMPWDMTDLHLGTLNQAGTLANQTTLKQPLRAAIAQPAFSPDGKLIFVADWTDWWNLYAWRDAQGEQINKTDAEFAWPNWVFGLRNYAVLSEEKAVVSYGQNGEWFLGELDLLSGELKKIGAAWSSVRSVTAVSDGAAFFAETPEGTTGLYALKDDKVTTLEAPKDTSIDAGDISIAQAIAFPTSDDETAYGFFYPPTNGLYEGPEGARPPLLVKVHGGPTTATTSAFAARTQYWTSRGFAILDLNYRGSTGFGRAYRHRLHKSWGLVDVDDAVYGARYLADQGLVDGDHLAISGGSAGGYTVLSALAFHEAFTAGASYYGVSDLEALAADTHKFESRYLDSMIGPYPQAIDVYKARSPINSIEGINVPLLILQGTEDKVVPPSQSITVYDALKKNNIPVAYIPFEGEQHGFRQAVNIERSLEAELYFYGRAFDFEPAGNLTPFPIDNETGFNS